MNPASKRILVIRDVTIDSRLNPAETEIEVGFVQVRSRKFYSGRISLLCDSVDNAAAGIPQIKHLGHFIERFSGSIIPCLSHQFHGGIIRDMVNARMPSGCKQGHKWK